jgi:hypothetical protein
MKGKMAGSEFGCADELPREATAITSFISHMAFAHVFRECGSVLIWMEIELAETFTKTRFLSLRSFSICQNQPFSEHRIGGKIDMTRPRRKRSVHDAVPMPGTQTSE